MQDSAVVRATSTVMRWAVAVNLPTLGSLGTRQRNRRQLVPTAPGLYFGVNCSRQTKNLLFQIAASTLSATSTPSGP